MAKRSLGLTEPTLENLEATITHRFIAKLADEVQKTQAILNSEGICYSMNVLSGPKGQQDKMENFLSLTGTLYVFVNS